MLQQNLNLLATGGLNLWAFELGIYYSNVYGEISFASLNILSSVLEMHV